MRDSQRVNSDGMGKSRGFGFVNFSDHDHAMKALENTNNQDVFSEKRVSNFDVNKCEFMVFQIGCS